MCYCLQFERSIFVTNRILLNAAVTYDVASNAYEWMRC